MRFNNASFCLLALIFGMVATVGCYAYAHAVCNPTPKIMFFAKDVFAMGQDGEAAGQFIDGPRTAIAASVKPRVAQGSTHPGGSE